MVDAHAIEVAVVGDPPHVLDSRGVREEAHSLQPTVPEGLIDCDDDLILGELIEDRSKHVHTSILPETALVVEQLVPDNVGDRCQLVVRTVLVEVYEVDQQIVGQGEVLSGYVLLPPQFDLVVGVYKSRFAVEIFFGRRHI